MQHSCRGSKLREALDPGAGGGLKEELMIPLGLLDELSATTSREEVLDVYARWSNRIIPSERCAVSMAFDDQTLQTTAIEGNAAIATGTKLPIEGSVLGLVYSSRKPLLLRDFASHADKIDIQLLTRRGLRAGMLAPILVGERCLGVLTAAFTSSDRIEERHFVMLQGLARCLGSYLLLHEQVEQLSYLVRVDPLTECFNRRYFENAVAEAWEEWTEWAERFCLVTGDIDHFKKLNDTYGHDFGDEVLRGVAEVLRGGSRPNDIVARVGGEEFTLILKDICLDEALGICERLRKEIEARAFKRGSEEVHISMSFGVATLRPDDVNARDLSIRSDAALYDAKNAGRNRVVAAA